MFPFFSLKTLWLTTVAFIIVQNAGAVQPAASSLPLAISQTMATDFVVNSGFEQGQKGWQLTSEKGQKGGKIIEEPGGNHALCAEGETYWMGSTDYHIVTKAPAPLDWARISQPLMGTPRAIAVASRAPHPAAARAFVDYWLSKKSMEMLAKDVGEYVLAPGIYPPIDGIKDAKVIAIRELSDAEIKTWGAEFKKIFDVK